VGSFEFLANEVFQMKILVISAALMTGLAGPAALAQSPPPPDEAPYYMDEDNAQPYEDDVEEIAQSPDPYGLDISGASAGESGIDDYDYDDMSPGAPLPED